MPIADAFLAAYLNDHLAGAASALSLLDHLASAYAGGDVASFAISLRAEVLADRQTLEQVMARLDVAQSMPRKAAAWLGEKLAELKLRADDPAKRGLHLLESFEALSLGIEGKRQLWLSLAAAAVVAPASCVADYDALRRRAEQQRADVEARRLAAARAALVG